MSWKVCHPAPANPSNLPGDAAQYSRSGGLFSVRSSQRHWRLSDLRNIVYDPQDRRETRLRCAEPYALGYIFRCQAGFGDVSVGINKPIYARYRR